MASSSRSLLAAALVLAAAPAAAQTPPPFVLAGRAARIAGADTVPLRGATVVGHHVSLDRQGPVDSVRTDAAGRFRLVIARPDTVGMYVVSTRHHGIGYFAAPVAATDRAAAADLLLVVYDTSSAGPPLVLAMRHVVVTAPGSGGGRPVMDVFQVHNDGPATRVGADSTAPTWRSRLPAGIEESRPGEGEVSPDAVLLAGGEVAVTAPFPPGDKQVVVTYSVPRGARQLRIPVDQPLARLELLIEDPGAGACGGGVRPEEPVVLQGRSFRRFSGDGVGAGAEVTVEFGAAFGTARRFSWIAVIAAAGALAAGAGLGVRRRGTRGRGAGAVPSDPDALATMIAALDERYEGREAETPPDDWERYRTRRAELKARLQAVLAPRAPA